MPGEEKGGKKKEGGKNNPLDAMVWLHGCIFWIIFLKSTQGCIGHIQCGDFSSKKYLKAREN